MAIASTSDEGVTLKVWVGSEEEWETLEALIEEAIVDCKIQDIQVRRLS